MDPLYRATKSSWSTRLRCIKVTDSSTADARSQRTQLLKRRLRVVLIVMIKGVHVHGYKIGIKLSKNPERCIRKVLVNDHCPLVIEKELLGRECDDMAVKCISDATVPSIDKNITDHFNCLLWFFMIPISSCTSSRTHE